MTNNYAVGYHQALLDTVDWLNTTVEEWYALQIASPAEAVRLYILAHEFEKAMLYDYREAPEDEEVYNG